MASKKNRISEELLCQSFEKAVLGTPGVSSLVSVPIQNTIRGKEYVKGIHILGNDDMILDIFINVALGTQIPQTAFAVQEAVKRAFVDAGESGNIKINIHVQGIDL